MPNLRLMKSLPIDDYTATTADLAAFTIPQADKNGTLSDFKLDAQGKSLQVQRAALNTRLMPHLGLFVQGAYGNPGLNMLKNEFTPYYVAGVRLSWNFGSLYTLRNDRRLIDNGFRQLESNREIGRAHV